MPDRITNTSNERVKFLRSLHEPRFQRQHRAFLVEGIRLVEEALDAGVEPIVVICAPEHLERTPRGRQLLNRLRPFHPLFATEQVVKAASQTVTPQGIIAAVPLPEQSQLSDEAPLLLVLDRLADPGNLGTILRAAWASGIVRSVVGLDSASFFGPKVVRAGAGAHFHLQLVEEDDASGVLSRLEGRRLRVAAVGSGVAYYDVDWRQPSALVIGSEAHGPSEPLVSAADELVHIPMQGGAESINAAVAAGILIFEAARQALPPLPLHARRGEG